MVSRLEKIIERAAVEPGQLDIVVLGCRLLYLVSGSYSLWNDIYNNEQNSLFISTVL